MLKNKKTITTVLSLSVMITPIIAVSCGGSLRFEQNNDGQIKLATSFAKNSPQSIAFEEIIKEYNKSQKDTDNFLPVTLEYYGITYPEAATKLENSLKVQDTVSTPNMIISFPSILATISNYDMQLSLGDKDNSDGFGISRDLFEEPFVKINDKVGGLKKDGIYSIPVASSTLITAINSPVLGYVFETMKAFGATVKAEDQTWYDQIVQAGLDDREYIKTLYGTPVEEEKSKYEGGKIVISKDIFDNSLDMLQFATNAQQLFTKTRNNPKGALHMMGIDNITTYLAVNAFSMTAKDANDFSNYFIKLKEDGFNDYTTYADENSEAYRSLSKIAKALIQAAKTGALYVANPPVYTTGLVKRHLMAFGIGSTAGYSFNFFESSSKPDSVIIKKGLDKKETNIDITLKGTVANVPRIDNESEHEGFITKISIGAGSSSIYKSGTNAANTRSGDIILANAETSEATANFIKNVKSQANTTKPIIIANSSDLDDFYKNAEGKKILESVGIMRLGTTTRGKGIYGVLDAATLNTDKIENNSYFDFRVFSEKETLQEKEVLGINAPRKWEKTDKISSVYVQGPVLAGIHSNDAEDKATRKFVKWLSSKTEITFKYRTEKSDILKYKDKDGRFTDKVEDGIKSTPFDYIADQTSYLVPYKGLFSKPFHAANKFVENTFLEFKKAVENKDGNWALLEEPVDSLTNSFRDALITAWRTPLILIADGNEANVAGSYAEDIVPRMKKLLEGTVIEQ